MPIPILVGGVLAASAGITWLITKTTDVKIEKPVAAVDVPFTAGLIISNPLLHPQVPIVPYIGSHGMYGSTLQQNVSGQAEANYMKNAVLMFAIATTVALVATGKLKINL